MAVCDARCCFTLLSVSDFGSNNDSGILEKSSVGKRFEEQKMRFPNAKPLLGYKGNLSYVLVGDEYIAAENLAYATTSRSSIISTKHIYLPFIPSKTHY